jgi:putative ABC transport system permease protein
LPARSGRSRLRYPGFNGPPDLIVGVVGDVKITGLDDAIKPVLYYPFQQSASMVTNLVVRTTADPDSLVNPIRNECRTLEPDVAVFGVRTIEEMINDAPAAFLRRFPAFLIGIFAVVALPCDRGIYGVVSYSVSQQTHDIGVGGTGRAGRRHTQDGFEAGTC